MPSVPTAFCVEGGGFTAMSMTMGFAHTFYDAGFFDRTTHMGGISGGTWFTTQFAYSKEFYESVTGINGDNVTQAASNWGAKYEEAMKEAVENALLNDIEYTVGNLPQSCAVSSYKPSNTSDVTMAEFWEELFNQLQYQAAWPASNYLYYVGSFLDPFIASSRETSFDAAREGYDGTLVIGVSLGPDVYGDDYTKQPKLEGSSKDFVPLIFSATPDNEGEWWYDGMESKPLNISFGTHTSNQETVKLELNPKASIAEVAAGSGSAFGLLGSPTLMKRMVLEIVKYPRFNLTIVEQLALSTGIDLCLPFGLQNISSPATPSDQADLPSWSPYYRYLDGAYSGDSTSVPHTISRIQKDCKSSDMDLDCTPAVKVALISDEPLNQFPNMCVCESTVRALFANCSEVCGVSTGSLLGLGDIYNPQIFAEGFPADGDSGWVLYSNKSYVFGENDTTPNLESWVWRGKLTTVDNPQWGIAAGTVIDFVYFAGGYPKEDSVIWPGDYATFAWSEIYAQVAQEQADAAQALLQSNQFIGSFFYDSDTVKEDAKEEGEEDRWQGTALGSSSAAWAFVTSAAAVAMATVFSTFVLA